MRNILFFAMLTAFLFQTSFVLGEGKSPAEALAEFVKLQNERIARGKELLTILDLIDMYDEAHKRKMLSQLAADGGPFFKIKGRWDLIDSASVALSWAYHEEEPFEDKILEVLEKTSLSSSDAEERFQIVALLYRYNKRGRDYLLKELGERRNVDAALILALNQEAEALSGIAEVFQSAHPPPELIYALGRWGQETTSLLSTGFLSSNGSPFDYMLAFTMAEHAVGKATLGRIQRLYENGQGATKTQAAAALCLLQPDAKEPLEYLSRKFSKERSLTKLEAATNFVIGSLPRIKSLQSREILRSMIETYVSQKEPMYVNPIQVEAARALLKVDGETEWPIVVEMLRKMVSEGISDKTDVYAIAEALHEVNSKKVDLTLKEIIGEELLTKMIKIHTLRILPRKFLPVSSRPFVGTSSSEE